MSRTVSMRYCVLAIALVFIVALPLSAAEEYGEERAPQVLLASEQTSFKNALVSSLIAQLEDKVYLRVVDHNRGELSGETASDYDAIIIINSGVNSQVRPRVSAWLKEVSDTEKIILLTTYRDLGWSPRYPAGVDSITSPSRKDEVRKLVNVIVTKVRLLTG